MQSLKEVSDQLSSIDVVISLKTEDGKSNILTLVSSNGKMLDTLIKYTTSGVDQRDNEQIQSEEISLKSLGKNSAKCPEVRNNFAWFAC